MPETTTSSHIIFKLQKTKDKQKILQQDRAERGGKTERKKKKKQRTSPYLRITVDLLETIQWSCMDVRVGL